MEQKLYEIANDIQALEDLDLPEDQIKDTLDGLQGTFELKAESVGKFMANLDGDIEKIDHEIKRLQNRKKVMENRKESIREYLRYNMAATGITRISCPLFTISLVKGRPMAVIEDDRSVPDKFKVTKTTVSISKADLLEALKAGEEVPGAKLGETAPSLRIK
jgi:hypothetical protein